MWRPRLAHTVRALLTVAAVVAALTPLGLKLRRSDVAQWLTMHSKSNALMRVTPTTVLAALANQLIYVSSFLDVPPLVPADAAGAKRS